MGDTLTGLFVIGVGAFLVAGPILVKRGIVPRVWAGTNVTVGTVGFVLWSVLVVLMGLLAIVLGLATLL